jgi:hypothetical protein
MKEEKLQLRGYFLLFQYKSENYLEICNNPVQPYDEAVDMFGFVLFGLAYNKTKCATIHAKRSLSQSTRESLERTG